MGPKWSEEMLIGLAYAFEQRTKVRDTVVPYILPTTELADVVAKKEVTPRGCRKSRDMGPNYCTYCMTCR